MSRGSRGVPGRRRRRQDGEPAQEAPRAARTAVDVDARDAEHHLAGRLRRDDRRGRLGQKRAALREGRRAAAIGEQAEVADAFENGVQSEPQTKRGKKAAA